MSVDSKASAFAYRRVVDRLHIDAVHAHEAIRRRLALPRVTNQHRHNVGLGAHDRQIVGDQQTLEGGGTLLEVGT
jgi:hypothetical protein